MVCLKLKGQYQKLQKLWECRNLMFIVICDLSHLKIIINKHNNSIQYTKRSIVCSQKQWTAFFHFLYTAEFNVFFNPFLTQTCPVIIWLKKDLIFSPKPTLFKFTLKKLLIISPSIPIVSIYTS